MSLFDNIIDDAAARFGLGAKAAPLLRELLQVMTTSPGGLSGFIGRLKSMGLSQVSGWLGNPNAAPLSAAQVEQALGSNTINAIAQKVGLSGPAATAAMGYLIPKVVGYLTPGGTVGQSVPSSVSDFLSTPRRADDFSPAYADQTPGGSWRWAAPLLALLALAGVGGYLYNHHWTQTPITTGAAPSGQTAVPSRLAISNDNGVITYSGTVRDQATKTSILDAMKGVFGANAIKGDIVVDPNAAPSPWLANLRNALSQLNMPGLHAMFEGNSVNLGGSVAAADRDRILNALKSIFGSAGLTFASADPMSSLVSESTNKASAALAALGSGFQPNDLMVILNKSIINFPTGSAEVPAMSRSLLQQAANAFKQLPANTVVEISGYTDNTGDPNANQQLSQRRAEAVKAVLVQSGVNGNMLSTKGYGSSNPVASNDTADGRFQNRRIEYQVASSGGTTQGSTQGSTKGSTQGSTQGSTPGSTPGTTQGATPGTTPGTTPGQTK